MVISTQLLKIFSQYFELSRAEAEEEHIKQLLRPNNSQQSK